MSLLHSESVSQLLHWCSGVYQWRGWENNLTRWPEVGGGGVVNAGFNLGTSGELQPQDFSPE